MKTNDIREGMRYFFQKVPRISIVMWCLYVNVLAFGIYRLYNYDVSLFWSIAFLWIGFNGAGSIFQASMKLVKETKQREDLLEAINIKIREQEENEDT